MISVPFGGSRFPVARSRAVLYRSKTNPFLGRNFEALDPIEGLARMSDHIPDPGQHRTLFYGEYSNRVRGAAHGPAPDTSTAPPFAPPPRDGPSVPPPCSRPPAAALESYAADQSAYRYVLSFERVGLRHQRKGQLAVVPRVIPHRRVTAGRA